MQFTIERIEENGLTLLRLKDKTNGTIVSVLPDHGALLHEFTVLKEGSAVNIIENYPDAKTLDAELDKSYRSAKLSPFVCRIDKAVYSYKGKTFEFTKKYNDGSAIHGLVYNKKFEPVDKFVNEQNACITLRYRYDADDPGYPYKFICLVSYTLYPNNILEVQTIIENADEEVIPLADGWHPYFKIGGNIANWELKFNTSKRVQFNDRLVPTGEFDEDARFLEWQKIGETKIDNCYLLEHIEEGKPVCMMRNPESKIGISVYADSGYPFLQIFTAVRRESVAIENLSSAPDCFNNRMGLLSLKPGEKQNFKLRYAVNGL